MIIKILDASGPDFNGVKYNDKKIEKGKGELTLMKNFPSFINENSNQQEVRNYLKLISKSNKVRKPQFHAVISTKFHEHTKDELTNIAEGFMNEMGYGTQPYIAVFHNDTENNHIHLVSTRVDKQTGMKINDSFEKLKAQKALGAVMEKLYDHNADKELDKLLNYRVGSLSQLEILISRSGYKIKKDTNDDKKIKIIKNGVVIKSLSGDQIRFDNSKNNQRIRQLRAVILKYKDIYSNMVFKVEDNRKMESTFPTVENQTNYPNKLTAFECELQKKLRDVFGLDVVFHHKEGNMPFGYTLIDHKNNKVLKGSEILKMNEIFDFTSDTIDKRDFERLKDYNISSHTIKERLTEFLNYSNQSHTVKTFMLFENKRRKDLAIYRKIQFEVSDFIKNRNQENSNLKFFTSPGDEKIYVVNSHFHYIGELKALVGEKLFHEFLTPNQSLHYNTSKTSGAEVQQAISDLLFEFMKSSGVAKDPAENELKKKRKRKK